MTSKVWAQHGGTKDALSVAIAQRKPNKRVASFLHQVAYMHHTLGHAPAKTQEEGTRLLSRAVTNAWTHQGRGQIHGEDTDEEQPEPEAGPNGRGGV